VADLGPGTRVRLARSDAGRRELALDRGHLHARVSAPPRLFVVTTPRAQVTDLGCEYTIDVAPDGTGTIAVARGMVELATGDGGVVVAPAGTRAAILASGRPGLPVGPVASSELIAAVAEVERGGPFEAVLAAAGPADAVTLIALAETDIAHRAAVLARLAELAPPPEPSDAVRAVDDAAARARWRDAIVSRFLAGASGGKAHKKP
jgi:hypothetical protein